MNKVRSKNSKEFSGRNRKFKRFCRPTSGDLQKEKKKVFTEITREFQAEIGNSSGFFQPKLGDLQKKKRSSSQKRHQIPCQSTNNTTLGLDLHSRSPEPVNFFEAQSSLGGAQIFVWGGTSSQLGGHGPGMLPRGAGSVLTSESVKHPASRVGDTWLDSPVSVLRNLSFTSINGLFEPVQVLTAQCRVVNGPTSSGPNPARTRKHKPKPGPKTNLKPESYPKKPES